MSRITPTTLGLAAALVLLGTVAPAPAATPYGGARYVVHDHRTAGDNWHVDARVGRRARAIKMLVLYSQRCGGETPFAQGVPIGPGGEVRASGPVDPADASKGEYSFEGRFVTRRRLEGTFSIVKRTCAAGPISFAATTTSDGHSGHDHPSGSHHGSGPAFGTMPDLSTATPRRLRQARKLWMGSLRTAARRFPTYRRARAQGYVRYLRDWDRPVLFHLRNHRYASDGRVLDVTRPESLVYYWPPKRKPVLVGFMFRAERIPAFASPLLAWHSHTTATGGVGRNQMTHVWLTRGLRSALANCMPVRQLEVAVPRFRYEPPVVGAAHESAPCP